MSERVCLTCLTPVSELCPHRTVVKTFVSFENPLPEGKQIYVGALKCYNYLGKYLGQWLLTEKDVVGLMKYD
mgnify:CR=1 FL=1